MQRFPSVLNLDFTVEVNPCLMTPSPGCNIPCMTPHVTDSWNGIWNCLKKVDKARTVLILCFWTLISFNTHLFFLKVLRTRRWLTWLLDLCSVRDSTAKDALWLNVFSEMKILGFEINFSQLESTCPHSLVVWSDVLRCSSAVAHYKLHLPSKWEVIAWQCVYQFPHNFIPNNKHEVSDQNLWLPSQHTRANTTWSILAQTTSLGNDVRFKLLVFWRQTA